MKRSHKRIMTLLNAGAECSTVDVKRPTIHRQGNVLVRPHRRVLDEMVLHGYLHRFYIYVGDGTHVDEFWHTGGGGDVPAVMCGKCEYPVCPVCHDHKQYPKNGETE